MHYGEIKNCDIADGLGVRVSLFVSGCRNHCKGCFNQMTWDFLYGKEFNQETTNKIIELLIINYIKSTPFKKDKCNIRLVFLKGSTFC